VSDDPGAGPLVPRPGATPYVEEALSADAAVERESGRWVVYLDVVLASGAVRRRCGDWPDERRALVAAREIERNARRHIVPAPHSRAGADDDPTGSTAPT
jgi:hypothetical protein